MSFLFGSSTKSSSSTTPTLTPQGQSLYSSLLSGVEPILNNPGAGLQPIQTAGEESINSSFGNISKIISKQMASRGYGSSGTMGDTMYQTQLGRLNSLSQYKGTMAQLASQRQMSAAQIMNQMLGTQVGSQGQSQTTTMNPMATFSALGAMLSMGLGSGGGGMPSVQTLANLPESSPNLFSGWSL